MRHRRSGTQEGRQAHLWDLVVSIPKEADPQAAAPVDTAPVAVAPVAMVPVAVAPVAVAPGAMAPVGTTLVVGQGVSLLVAGAVLRVETQTTPPRVRPVWGCPTLRIRPA